MAVYRIPPVAQFQQPRLRADVRSVDAPIPLPPGQLPRIEWLRRRHDYESEQQQPRRLLDVSVTQSVDSPIPKPPGQLLQVEWLRRRHDAEAEQAAVHLVDTSFSASVDSPIPQPLPTVEWLRRRADYESEQQPRRLIDTSVSQSVDSPIPSIVPLELPVRARWPYPAPHGLPVDILAPAVVADSPTGAPFVQWVGRPPAWEAWLQADRLPIDYTQSVDSPPGFATQRPASRQTFTGQQSRLLPVDILAPVVTPDNPTGVQAQQVPYLRAPSPAYWQNRVRVDTTVSQSVDAPPGFFVQQPALRPTSLTQWHQQTPGLISSPDSPAAPVQQAAAYLRGAAALQAYQKTPSVLFLVTVESPPTAGPFQPAIYRRPVPPTPYRLPSTSVMVAEPVAPVDPAPYLATAMERFGDEAMERFMATALERFVDDVWEAFDSNGTEQP